MTLLVQEAIDSLDIQSNSILNWFYGTPSASSPPSVAPLPNTTPNSTTTNELILITGGSLSDKVGNSVELLHPNGTHMCELEPLPDKRYDHTQSGLIACGGYYTQTSCLIFSNGVWQHHSTLNQPREDHSVWNNGTTTLLIGGLGSPMTTEVISTDSDHHAPFNLTYPTEGACVISLDDRFLVTGGFYDPTRVTMYDYEARSDRVMPSLNGKGRRNHGCGKFIDNQHRVVFIVAGGYAGSSFLSSTEMLIGEDASAWTWGGNLPSGRDRAIGVSVANRFLLTGGWSSDDGTLNEVLITEDGKNWNKTGTMKYAREYPGASLVPGEIQKYCKTPKL